MSETNGVIDETGVAPADPEPEAPAQDALPTEIAEDDHPDAVATPSGQKFVPLAALKAARDELKSLKPLAEHAQHLDAYVRDVRPYVEFLKANPQLIQGQATPQAPASPQADAALVELARTLELYDPQTGQPDVKRADVIRQMTRAEAEAIADQRIAPVQERSHEQQAAANLQAIAATTDADGRALEQQYLLEAVRTVTDSLPKAEAVRLLADAKVASLIRLTALGLQGSRRKSGPAAPSSPALHVESPGGGSGYVMTEESRKLARAAGISEKDWAEKARSYKPGQSNVLE